MEQTTQSVAPPSVHISQLESDQGEKDQHPVVSHPSEHSTPHVFQLLV